MLFQMSGDNRDSLDITEIYARMKEIKPDVFSIEDSSVFLDLALKEFVKFVATYLDDQVTFVAYLYKLLFV